MYKRIPASFFNDFEDVYFSMIEFMQECGFTVEATGGIDYHTSRNVRHTRILQDPNTKHKLCIICQYPYDSVYIPHNVIHFYIIDELVIDNRLNKQGNIVKSIFNIADEPDVDRYISYGAIFCYGDPSAGNKALKNYDLICVYNNKSLIFAYVPTNCYIYSHIYEESSFDGSPRCGSFIFYGNFTKYCIQDVKDVVYLVSSYAYSTFCERFDDEGNSLGEKLSYNPTGMLNNLCGGLLYCNPEGSYDIGKNNWFVENNWYGEHRGYNPPSLTNSFNFKVINRLVSCEPCYNGAFNRDRLKIEGLINNTSVLMPLVVYGLREPVVLDTWSAIGETKLVNMIGMSHISSGDIFIDTSVEKDYHKYFVFPCLTGSLSATLYTFLGLAIEIEAKEDLLHSQSEDYLTINLNDRFRNFDRIEVIYGDNKEIEWRYDDLEVVYDTDGIFNLTKDDTDRCLVYGLKNTDGKSTEYRFTCSESCKIISITGYRE